MEGTKGNWLFVLMTLLNLWEDPCPDVAQCSIKTFFAIVSSVFNYIFEILDSFRHSLWSIFRARFENSNQRTNRPRLFTRPSSTRSRTSRSLSMSKRMFYFLINQIIYWNSAELKVAKGFHLLYPLIFRSISCLTKEKLFDIKLRPSGEAKNSAGNISFNEIISTIHMLGNIEYQLEQANLNIDTLNMLHLKKIGLTQSFPILF